MYNSKFLPNFWQNIDPHTGGPMTPLTTSWRRSSQWPAPASSSVTSASTRSMCYITGFVHLYRYQEYVFEMDAIENGTWARSVDWNRSIKTVFATSDDPEVTTCYWHHPDYCQAQGPAPGLGSAQGLTPDPEAHRRSLSGSELFRFKAFQKCKDALDLSLTLMRFPQSL